MAPIYVIGHVNPDTDSIASAMGYAWLLKERDGSDTKAARLGSINAQTSWALERLNFDPPELLADASPRFQAVARRLDSVTPERSLSEAWMIVNRTGTVAPVVEPDGCPYGLITGFSLFSYIRKLVGPHPDRSDVRLAEIFEHEAKEAADTTVPRFTANARIRDALPRILREERTDFWVVDEHNRYMGICRQADLLNPPRMQLVLVDHNEVGQSIGSVDEAEIQEVLDHHRLGNPPTRIPIRFRVDPVGSTSTLVSERIESAGLSAPPELAGLLLAGLLSDTLILSSPTTTDRDHDAAERLGRWAFVGGGLLESENIETFGTQLLAAGAGLSARNLDELVESDIKIYQAGDWKFSISQVEVTDMHEFSDHLDELEKALDQLQARKGYDFSVLMVTDVVEGSSQLLLRSAPALLDDLPYPKLPDGSLTARGVVSRKKQLLPVMLAMLEG